MPKSVLIAVVDIGLRATLVAAVAGRGFAAFGAAEGREAIALMAGVKVDVAVIDDTLSFNGSNVFVTVVAQAKRQAAKVVAIRTRDEARPVETGQVDRFVEREVAMAWEVIRVIEDLLGRPGQ